MNGLSKVSIGAKDLIKVEKDFIQVMTDLIMLRRDMKTDLLPPKEGFQEETLDKVLERYSGFGRDLYRLIENKIPLVFSKLRFYQETSYQMGDSYAVYDDADKSFAIQLDPDIEVIVLWNQDIQTEIGNWVDKPEEEAMIFIQDNFLKD